MMTITEMNREPFALAIDAERQFLRDLWDAVDKDRRAAVASGQEESAFEQLLLQVKIVARLDRCHSIMCRRYPCYDQLFNGRRSPDPLPA